jgi:hypothetical protein
LGALFSPLFSLLSKPMLNLYVDLLHSPQLDSSHP